MEGLSLSSFSAGVGPSLRDVARAWQAMLGRLEFEVSKPNFETWFRPTKAIGCEGARLLVEAPNSFAASQLNDRFTVVVDRVAEELFGGPVSVRFVPRGDAGDQPVPMALYSPTSPLFGMVNPRYSLDGFEEFESNRMALNACRDLFQADRRISPVLVWGPCGMGKSHLLHATAADACRRGWRVACVTAEEFTTLYMSAVRRDTVEEFQRGLRGVQLLVIDDVQYLAGKRGTVDELVHTMEAVSNAGGAVVVGADQHPFEMAIPERLRTRLVGGVAAQVTPLAGEDRRRFVTATATALRSPIPAWAAERIACTDGVPVRVLHGAVCAAISLERGGNLDLGRLDAELVRLGAFSAARTTLTDAEVLAGVAEHFGVQPHEVAGRSRQGKLRDARAVAVAALKSRGRSLSQIAALLDGRDPSTLSTMVERGRALLEDSPGLQSRLAG